MGASLPRLFNMRACAFVLLAVAAVHCDSDAYTIGQVAHGLPVHNAFATGHPHNVGIVTGVGYGHFGHYGKREAEAEPYTIGQVAHGLPIAHAVASGRAHNVGVITGVSYGHGLGYGGYGHLGGYYGKREADSDAYTIGQVAHGLHRGIVTGVSYGHGIGYGGYGHGLGYGYAGHLYG